MTSTTATKKRASAESGLDTLWAIQYPAPVVAMPSRAGSHRALGSRSPVCPPRSSSAGLTARTCQMS